LDDAELIAQELSGLAGKVDELERSLQDVEKVNARLEQAALTTVRALTGDLRALGCRLRGHASRRSLNVRGRVLEEEVA
jgi:hypothetical protein